MSDSIVKKSTILRISMINHFLKYDTKNNIDSINLIICKKLDYNKKSLIFRFITNSKLNDINIIKKYDFLGNDRFIPLANQKAIDVIKTLNKDNFEIFDTIIVNHRNELISDEYKLINILSTIQIADMSRSIIDECFVQNNLKLNYYTKLVLKKDIETHDSHIFRDKINNGITKYVSNEFYNIYKKNKLTGLIFTRP